MARLVALLAAAALVAGCARTVDVASPRPLKPHVLGVAPGEPQVAPDAIDCAPSPTPVLVVRDGDEYGGLVALFNTNVVSAFATPTVVTTSDYRSGDVDAYAAVVYVGTAAGAPLPADFLDDIARTDRPVLWAGANIDQLFRRHPELTERMGWRPGELEPNGADRVVYKGRSLLRAPESLGPVTAIEITDDDRAETLAVFGGRKGAPWAVRSGTLTFVAEIAYADSSAGDRYLAWADIVIGVLAPDRPERHRAMVRIEDVGPMTDPRALRKITDMLRDRDVPFSLAVYPFFRDPTGATTGRPMSVALSDRPELVEALHHAIDNGATLLLHGVTHQYGSWPNPYSAMSGADYEFYVAYVDEQDNVVLTGPVPEDSPEWVVQRVQLGLAEFERAGLPKPTIFEFPHYAGSPTDYAVIAQMFPARYERSLYFSGPYVEEQYVPYVVRDVYGACVIPETLGFVAPEAWNNHPRRLPADILADAERVLVVRDGIASFFFHPTLPLEQLREIVDGITDLGYEWVGPANVLSGDA